MRRAAASFLAASALIALAAPNADAAGPPTLGAAWSSAVQTESARLTAQVNPNGLGTSVHFEYIKDSAYQQNLGEAKDGFTGASKQPPVTDSNIGSSPGVVTYQELIAGLAPDTAYRYRIAAKNFATAPSYVLGSPHLFVTLPPPSNVLLPDSRGWEMVSPIQKNGGLVDAPGAIGGGGVLQAAADGESITYGSTASFAEGGGGAAFASQYIAHRGSTAWLTENITPALFSGSYNAEDLGVPYQLFSGDLARGLLLNGQHCRGEASGCAVANPPIPGSNAPAGYQNYYLRESAPVGFDALLGLSDVGPLSLSPANFDLHFAGAAPDLHHIILSTCAALTANATEVPLGPGCDPTKANLYEWAAGVGLSLVNVSPGATLGAQSGAISTNGSRVYWSDQAGNLFLREGALNEPVGAGVFQTASASGATAFYIDGANHLQKYDAVAHSSTDLTPSGGVDGVLGASEDGKYIYFATGAGIFLWHEGTTTSVAAGTVDPSSYPPTTGAARVSADGVHLAFISKASLTGYDNTDLGTGNADAEVYIYEDGAPNPLKCVSCNPTNERPIGPSSIPGAMPNGTAPGSTDSYKPRVLSQDGRRVFFESRDSLASTDTNLGSVDLYQWEAQGVGNCARPNGCVALVSYGRNAGGAQFIDASADGDDVFFLTDASLIPSDTGSLDLYDARVGGGYPIPSPPTACEGDACQPLEPPPVDPTLTTLTAGHGNPPVHYFCLNCKHKKKKHPKHHKRHHRRQQSSHHRGGQGR